MSALSAIMYREGKIRATNLTFIFWDLFYPLGYLLVFGVGMTQAMGMKPLAIGVDYNAFFLAGVLGMASFGIASNTAWSFFMDRDNGIFFEMLTYPMRRSEYLLGKGPVQPSGLDRAGDRHGRARGARARRAHPLGLAAAACGCGVRRHGGMVLLLRDLRVDHPPQRRVQHRDVGLLFRAAVRQLDVLSRRAAADAAAAAVLGQPITWHVDVLRYATIGVGEPAVIAVEAAAFCFSPA
jgi:hypothetical protein